MTVQDLIDLLQRALQRANVSPDTEIVLPRDTEGLIYTPMMGTETGCYYLSISQTEYVGVLVEEENKGIPCVVLR
jgi:hypothetical protein